MTPRAPSAVPPGMPAHLWEAAKRDVRGVIPDWLRSAQENGADAPPHIREVARRAAKAGAGLGMAIAVGSQVHAAADSTGPGPGAPAVTTVAHTTPDVPDPVPGPVAGPGVAEAPTLAESFRVLDPQGVGDGWLNVEMYQDVVVNEGADAMYDVDAFQYLIISDEDGRNYVFKEHHHAAVPEPPARETDLLIHERGQVHVVENPDGSFSVATVSYDRSVNGLSEPSPESGLGDDPPNDDPPSDDQLGEQPDAPADEVGDPGWTPPVGLAAPVEGPATSEGPAPVDAAGTAFQDTVDTPDPSAGHGGPDHPDGTLAEPDPATAPEAGDDHDGNDPPDLSELAG